MVNNRKQIVENYIKAYNAFDIPSMLKNLDQQVVFENIEGDMITDIALGKRELETQALKVKDYFKTRKQTVTKLEVASNLVTVNIDYEAILAIDFSEDIKAGSQLKLKGKSLFTFKEDKIVKIQDIS